MAEPKHHRNAQEISSDPAREMSRLRTRALGDFPTGSQPEVRMDDLEIWRPRRISSHRPILGTAYVGLRRWIYREICLAVEKALRMQGTINREFARAIRSRRAESGEKGE
jgi:hypothetical protein